MMSCALRLPTARRSVALAVVVVSLAAAPVGAGDSGATAAPRANAADTVVSCPGNRRLGTTFVYYGDLSVRNMSCRRGRRLLRAARLTRSGGVRIERYRCRLIGTYGDGGIFRCVRGRYALRFKAGG